MITCKKIISRKNKKMVVHPQLRSASLRNYVLKINKVRRTKKKKSLSTEKVAKKLIEASSEKLRKELIML